MRILLPRTTELSEHIGHQPWDARNSAAAFFAGVAEPAAARPFELTRVLVAVVTIGVAPFCYLANRCVAQDERKLAEQMHTLVEHAMTQRTSKTRSSSLLGTD